MGRFLLAASDEPDLVSAVGDAGVLEHGDHVGVGAELTGHAHDLPQQAYLTSHRLLRGRPKEGPDSQSESSTSSHSPIRSCDNQVSVLPSGTLRKTAASHLATTLIGSLWTMAMSGSAGRGGSAWNWAGRKKAVWTSFWNWTPSSIMWM